MSRELTHAIAALKINCPPNLVEIVRNLEAAIRKDQDETAAKIRDLDARLADACSMTLSDKPMCIACFETEPHTGNCGSTDPRALCNQPDAKERLVAARTITNGLLYTLHPYKKAEPTPMGNTSLLRSLDPNDPHETSPWPKFMKFAEPNTPPEKDE